MSRIVIDGTMNYVSDANDIITDIGDLNGINTTGITDGQILVYNSSTGDLEPSNFTEQLDLDDLQDVDTGGVVDGDILQYNGSASEWRAVNLAAASVGEADLADLQDVTFTSLADGDLIVRNGSDSEWQNITVADLAIDPNDLGWSGASNTLSIGANIKFERESTSAFEYTAEFYKNYTSTALSSDNNVAVGLTVRDTAGPTTKYLGILQGIYQDSTRSDDIVRISVYNNSGNPFAGTKNFDFTQAGDLFVPNDVDVATDLTVGGTLNTHTIPGGTGTLALTSDITAIDNVVEDTSPQLGGDLDLNSNNITGTGNIDTTGSLTLTSTDASSSAGPELVLYRNSASPDDGDYLGQIQFKGRQDGPGDEIYAKITGKIRDATNGTEDGLIETAIKGDGSFTIVSRQRSDELQLINGVGLTVAGDTTLSGTLNTHTIPSGTGTIALTSDIPSNIEDLSNVDTTGVVEGNLLYYAGSAGWADTGGALSWNDSTDTLTITGEPEFSLHNNTAHGNNAVFAKFELRGEDNASAETLYGRIDGRCIFNGSPFPATGNIEIITKNGGSETTAAVFGNAITASGSNNLSRNRMHLPTYVDEWLQVDNQSDDTNIPTFYFTNTKTGADDDIASVIETYARNDNDSQTKFSRIQTTIVDATDGSEDGDIVFSVMVAGSEADILSLGSENRFYKPTYQDNWLQIQKDGSSPILYIVREDTGSDGDTMGEIQFYGKDSGGANVRTSRLRSVAVDATDGTEDSKFELLVQEAGSEELKFSVEPDRVAVHNGVFQLPAYASSSLPTGVDGALIAISDNSYKTAYYDGSDWRYVDGNATV